jgi:probable HAF family extracellular repeat protein
LAALLLLLALGAAFLAVGGAAGTSQPRIVDLGVLDDSVQPMGAAVDVNEAGQVVGNVRMAGDAHAFSWTAAAGMIDLGTLGGSSSAATAVNESGQVVGWATTASGGTHAFSWTAPHGMVDLGVPEGATSSAAVALNDAGQVVGTARTAAGETHAFSWTKADGMVDLGTLGFTYVTPVAVNASGQVVGTLATDSRSRAFSWTKTGGLVDLGTLGGTDSWGADVNDAGLVVGSARTATGRIHAVTWTSTGGLVDLWPTASDTSAANAVNEAGHVTGTLSADGGFKDGTWNHVFLWSPAAGMVDLGTLQGRQVITPAAINDLDEIVGRSYACFVRCGPPLGFASTASRELIPLGTLAGQNSTWANDLNDAGQIVGVSGVYINYLTPPGPHHAVLWQDAPTVPDRPRITSVVAGDGHATVSFEPPASDGGAQISYFTVTASPGGASASGTTSPITVFGLANGTTYRFTVTATNDAGRGTPSVRSEAVVPSGADRGIPDPPAESPRPEVPELPTATGPHPPPPRRPTVPAAAELT